jgi:cysteine desulfurase family protein (TIGR01976 family)
MLTNLDVVACRCQFPGLARRVGGRPAVFLDGPGGTQVPRCVIDAVTDVLAHRNANDGGIFATSQEVGAMVKRARSGVADLLGATDPDTIVFGPNMTTLTFALSRSLAKTWRPRDEIIVTRLDHDANITPWALAAAAAGSVVREIDIDPADCTLRLENLVEMMTERVRLVAVAIASNAVGTINPIRELVEVARRVGAKVFVDAVHAAPHVLLDVEEMGADFVACSAYKFFGPHMGILWVRRELLEQLPVDKVRPAPNDLPGRWMTGKPNFEGIAGVLAAVEYLANLGRAGASRREALVSAYAAIQAQENALTRQFLTGIRSIPAWKVWGITDPNQLERRVSTFGVTHRQREPADIAAAFAAQGLFVWHGHFYAARLIETLGLAPHGMIRIGFLHYNTTEEVDRVLEAFARVDA